MKIASVVGARPQFIKEAPVGRELRTKHDVVLVHTGQHYDHAMSQVFFDELGIPRPDHNLGVGSGSHGAQTGEMLAGLERVFVAEKPDLVLVYGDTNSTIAAALAAAKLHIKVAHVEAGLRSFDRAMPEEINRILTDHASDVLFAPTETAVRLLAAEGITKNVHLVGDVMIEAHRDAAEAARKRDVLGSHGLAPKSYLLATIHRPSNTDDPAALKEILAAFGEIGETIVFPLHPRTKARIDQFGLAIPRNVRIVPPAGYLEFVALEAGAKRILTDSGGVQKEAYFLRVPCVTLRENTEWTETVEDGWNVLVGSDRRRIVEAGRSFTPAKPPSARFGAGDASRRIREILEAGGY
ncbi:MAG TPA: UDP-N-acetylglucosamine 2-epimerase (non-hydrolyzing) [Candidatus Thermoplasmatota archaeon]|nr:UDP-N-acetylglucosamine 2-epimerase (non-hydrolyzing) [Candidatus Thermoplasmatota archaeon]